MKRRIEAVPLPPDVALTNLMTDMAPPYTRYTRLAPPVTSCDLVKQPETLRVLVASGMRLHHQHMRQSVFALAVQMGETTGPFLRALHEVCEAARAEKYANELNFRQICPGYVEHIIPRMSSMAAHGNVPPLHDAVQHNRLSADTVATLARLHTPALTFPNRHRKEMPLHIAVSIRGGMYPRDAVGQSRNAEVVDVLLAAAPEVASMPSRGRRLPIHVACCNGACQLTPRPAHTIWGHTACPSHPCCLPCSLPLLVAHPEV